MNGMKIKAVLLDLDGTLLETYDDFARCANAVLRTCGYAPHGEDFYLPYFGAGIRDIFRQILPECVPAEIDRVMQVYERVYAAGCLDKTAPYPGMAEALEAMVAAGLQIAVITNKTESVSQMQVRHYYPDFPFAFVWGDTGERALKPEPEMGLAACGRLGLRPEEIVYVGDSETDMQFAGRAGFFALGAAWGYRGRARLEKAGAGRVIDSARGLPEAIRAI